jgi:high-affinity nickel permease
MNEIFLPTLAGLTLGSLHAFDADHVAAVSVFVSRHPQPKRAVMFGIWWALGHTATLFVLGLTSMSLKLVISPLIETVAEVGVGIMLIVLGGWGMHHLVRRERVHIHRHVHDGVEHIHFHSHVERSDHRHEHSMFLVGAAHGFAGTASVMVVIPIAIVSSALTASLYILLFGIGTMIAMATFAYLLGNIVLAVKRKNLFVWLQGIAGMVSILVGCVWILERVI